MKTSGNLPLFRSALVLFLTLTVVLGILYPLFVTAVAQVAFPTQANGSIVRDGDEFAGSTLLGQANTDPRYFWSRPSATNYNAQLSGASNEGPTSRALARLVRQRAAEFQAAHGLPVNSTVPVEMLFASGSGLDPHISPNAARLQVRRVAQARGVDQAIVARLVEGQIEPPQLGFLGQPRVNVLMLNLALDGLE
jgi:potassium-transporting ATPase KdpC subunit